jgi:hypothetical protein
MGGRGTPTDPRNDPLFLGREQELRQIIENIHSGTHTLIVGEKGIGKSALIAQALAVFLGRVRKIDLSMRLDSLEARRLRRKRLAGVTMFLIENASPLGDCLREIAEQIWRHQFLPMPDHLKSESDWIPVRRWFTGLGRVGQQDVIWGSLRRQSAPILIVFDSLDRVTPAHQQFLEPLFSMATIVAASSRLNEAFHFKKVWSSFSRIDLQPLPKEIALELVNSLIDNHRIRPSDRELFVREVLKSSAGNPFHIRNIVWHSSRQRTLDEAEIRSYRRIEEGAYFNMGPIYIFGASIFTLYKILSIGMDSNFFIFRPQRQR